MNEKALEIVLEYHERTKHDYFRSARSPGYMDWDTQPDPFRRYLGAELVSLPFPRDEEARPYDEMFRPSSGSPAPVNLKNISSLFYYSLAISAWKSISDASWSLRVNPSSGNLHPTEGYLVASSIEGLQTSGSVCHYAPKEHGLEVRTTIDDKTWKSLTSGFDSSSFFVGLSSIHWRESWKYGERAYRYCQHDLGHALGALRFAASMLGWRLFVLPWVSTEEITKLLGLANSGEEDEREEPGLIAVITPGNLAPSLPTMFSREALDSIDQGEWHGKANQLSSDHLCWNVIDAVSEACHIAPPTGSRHGKSDDPKDVARRGEDQNWTHEKTTDSRSSVLIRQRRSAVDMDGETFLEASRFFVMLGRLVPSLGSIPWDCVTWPNSIDAGLFVHRVSGLESGIYALVRDADRHLRLKTAMNREFLWTKPKNVPGDLPLYLLAQRDVRDVAAGVSCSQAIAGDGAFSLGMLADFEASLQECGAHHYRRLFWEAGILGQILYLEAEACGIRSTGIGCYFDDPVHQVFGLSGRSFQSMYHFTVGGPVEDDRLTTLPAYESRK